MSSHLYATALASKGSPLYVPFTVLGDPNREASLQIVRSLLTHGADALELGLPFSDPPADGPVIQAADTRALQSGVRVDDCFDLLQAIRRETKIPIGLLVYYNLLLQRGIDRFYHDCSVSGVTSVLVADLPLEHASACGEAAKRHGIAPVFMVSERTTDERLAAISSLAEGYLYVVSYVGITGVQNAIAEDRIRQQLVRIRRHTDLPLIVGFGINTLLDAQAVVRAGADGVIVASRLIRELPDVSRMVTVSHEFADALRSSLMREDRR